MPPDTSISLLNFGKLSKPADTLIKKISNAASVLFEPRHIKRIAKAKAEAARIEAQSEIEITDLHQRAARRWIEEEARRQRNMENITAKALRQLHENAQPDAIEDDWIVNFFDKSRIVPDNEMQDLWSRVLVGEANSPGTYSKRTVNFLSDLDKAEAELFTKLCGFGWQIGNIVPLVFDAQAKIYNGCGINFGALSHLDSIGLVQFDNFAGFRRLKLPKIIVLHYYGRPLRLHLPKDTDNNLDVGKVLLTRIGQELAPICGSEPVEGFWEFARDKWKNYLPKPAINKGAVSGSDNPNTPSKVLE